jgi:hypothetical protein
MSARVLRRKVRRKSGNLMVEAGASQLNMHGTTASIDMNTIININVFTSLAAFGL